MYSSSLHFYLNFSNFYRLKKRTFESPAKRVISIILWCV